MRYLSAVLPLTPIVALLGLAWTPVSANSSPDECERTCVAELIIAGGGSWVVTGGNVNDGLGTFLCNTCTNCDGEATATYPGGAGGYVKFGNQPNDPAIPVSAPITRTFMLNTGCDQDPQIIIFGSTGGNTSVALNCPCQAI